MPRFSAKRYEQILAQMIAKVVGRTNLSDVSDASAWKHLLAAAARQDDEQYYQMTLLLKLFSIDSASGDDLDERAKEIQPGTVTRTLANKASGNVVIYRTGVVGAVAIASGTKVTTSSGQVFTTTAAGNIAAANPPLITGHVAGQDSGLIPAVADVAGADGNVVASTITKFVSKPVGVEGVSNIADFNFGADKETDSSFRSRLKQYINSLSRGTIQALENAVLGAEDEDTGGVILFAKAVEDIVNLGNGTMYIDDGTGYALSIGPLVVAENMCAGLAGPPANTAVGGEEYLSLDHKPINPATLVLTHAGAVPIGVMTLGTDYYFNEASGQVNFIAPLANGDTVSAAYTYYTGLIAEAQKIVDGDPSDYTNYPGYRAGGTKWVVSVPVVQIQTITLSIVIADGFDTDTVESAVQDAIREYINNLGISDDVLRSEIINTVMNVNGVYDTTLTLPANNVVLLDDQLARTTDANITVN